MRPTQRVHTVEGSLDGHVIEMGIDENARAHIMSVLTNLYSDTELAVIREYSCNARDSHIEAGNSAPIEITLPTTFSHDFIVRDYGIGLSIDEISAIYSRYGASTKRGTDEQTGMLGLGCKSGLTYAPSFQVTSWKNGVKTQVLVSQNAEGIGVMEVIDTCASDEPTGVEIRIPVQARNSFAQKVKEFFQYWDEGTVLVDGAEPKRLGGNRISDEFLITGEVSNDIIVMGGVAYPAAVNRWDYPLSKNVSGHVVHFADIGSVNFTPSREELMFTAKTKAYIDEAAKAFQAALMDAYQRDQSTVTSHNEAFILANKWRRISGSLDVTYKGQKVPAHFSPINGETAFLYNPSGYSRAKRGSVTEQRSFGGEAFAEGILVTGTTVQAISHGIKDRVAKWAEDNEVDFEYVVFCNNPFGQPWVTPLATVDYATIKAVKVPRLVNTSSGSTVVRTHPYDLLQSDGSLVETSNISQKVVYGSPTDFPTSYRGYPTEIRKHLFILMESLGYQVVLIGKNRWDKFQRDFTHAKRVDEFIKAHYAEVLDNQDEGEIIRRNFTAEDRQMSDFLYPSYNEIADPEVARQVRLASDPAVITSIKEFDKYRGSIRLAGLSRDNRPNYVPGPEHMDTLEILTGVDNHRASQTLLVTYPMCYAQGSKFLPHHIAYINAVHKEDN